MDREDSAKLSQLVAIVTITFVIGLLYFAKQVLQPLAMAGLLTFLLAPLVSHLERKKIARVPAVLMTIGVTCLVFLGMGWAVTGQVIELAGKLPEYQENLSARIRSLRGADNATFREASAMVNELLSEATQTLDPTADDQVSASLRPVQVTVVESSPIPVRILRDWVGPVLSPFGTAAVIVLFMIFMLIYHEDLRNRLIQLAGPGQLIVTTQALDEAGSRVSNYLVRLSIVNSTYGLGVAIGLWVIGIPSPLLWGFLAAVLRFVPYVGPWISAILPIALSLAAFEGWARPVATIGLFVVLELVSNNIIEPWLYAKGTGVSVVGIIASALFWTWLWGPLGLVLSMPLTVCLTVMGRHVPGLRFVTVLLSDQPALTYKLRLYQRMLALDYQEASDVVDEFLAGNSVEELYSSVLMPSLRLAERDRQNGQLADAQKNFIYNFVRDTIDEQAKADLITGPAELTGQVVSGETNSAVVPQPAVERPADILCLPAEDNGDALAGEMVAQALVARGYSARALTANAGRAELEATLRSEGARIVVISAVAPGGAMSARELCRRFRLQFSDLTLVVGLWNAGGELIKTRERLTAAGANGVATRLIEAVDFVQEASDIKAQNSQQHRDQNQE